MPSGKCDSDNAVEARNVAHPRHQRRLAHQCGYQAIDMNNEAIPGLFCGGDAAGGFSMRGLPRAICRWFIAGRNAVTENEPA